jgi:hypothetical protein
MEKLTSSTLLREGDTSVRSILVGPGAQRRENCNEQVDFRLIKWHDIRENSVGLLRDV